MYLALEMTNITKWFSEDNVIHKRLIVIGGNGSSLNESIKGTSKRHDVDRNNSAKTIVRLRSAVHGKIECLLAWRTQFTRMRSR